MSKCINVDKLKLSELLTVKSFIEQLKEKGYNMTKPAVHYQLKNTNNLDYCDWQDLILIVNNSKAKSFVPKGH